jgi:hypothetical protein
MVFYNDYPAPEEVLRLGPARNIAFTGTGTGTGTGASSDSQLERLEREVLQEVSRQIISGRSVNKPVIRQ